MSAQEHRRPHGAEGERGLELGGTYRIAKAEHTDLGLMKRFQFVGLGDFPAAIDRALANLVYTSVGESSDCAAKALKQIVLPADPCIDPRFDLGPSRRRPAGAPGREDRQAQLAASR